MWNWNKHCELEIRFADTKNLKQGNDMYLQSSQCEWYVCTFEHFTAFDILFSTGKKSVRMK